MVLKVTRAWNNQKLCNSNTSASNTSPRKRKNRQYAGYAGKQCTSNAYFALIFFVTNNICIWKDFDVDNILEQGYELLRPVYIEYIHVPASKLAHKINLFVQKDNLFENCRHNNTSEKGDGAISVCEGFSIIVLRSENHVYFFNFYSSNSDVFTILMATHFC